MTETFEVLLREFNTTWPSLAAVRERYFSHIKTDRHLRDLIKAGRIELPIKKLCDSVRAGYVIHLSDLAAYLDLKAKQPA
ncbi:MAG: pyocin activator PrtN family protein [Pseudomonas farsensis]|uniref:pyocin activator PrtN family protein n=1 Tax=Pseudomonas farsensis TaxID=2745492 RepID=UPI003C7BB087